MKKTLSCFALLVLVIGSTLVASAQITRLPITGPDCRYLVAGRTDAHSFEGYINTELFPLPGMSGVYPNAGTGTITFNADGTVGGATAIKIGPAYFDNVPMINATYRVSWDVTKTPVVCMGTMKTDMPQSPTGTENWQVVVTKGGDQVELIHTDMGLIVGVAIYPAAKGGCGNGTLHSAYTYNAKGWTLPPPNLPPPTPADMLNGFVPFAFNGAIVFRPELTLPNSLTGAPPGSAYLQGWDMVSMAGFIMPRTYVGWYKVEVDCSATMVLLDNIGTPLIHTKVQIFKNADAIGILNVDVPMALAFTAERQR